MSDDNEDNEESDNSHESEEASLVPKSSESLKVTAPKDFKYKKLNYKLKRLKSSKKSRNKPSLRAVIRYKNM